MADTDRGVAVVVGGSRGIGRASAAPLVGQGLAVVVTGRTAESASRAAEALSGELGTAVDGSPLDVGRPGDVSTFFTSLARERGRLDVLVVSAGVMPSSPIGMIRPESVDDTLRTNLAGAIHCLQAGARVMMRRRSGAVVLVGSVVGERGAAGQVVYAASKGAISAVTRSAAKELGRFGIRVNAVAPGIIRTDMTAGLTTELVERRVADTALGRLGEPEDVARVIAFLASDDASFVTGQIVGVDGGLVL
jgi:3-oxoacyl-[acyl-carrier protein] reductase